MKEQPRGGGDGGGSTLCMGGQLPDLKHARFGFEGDPILPRWLNFKMHGVSNSWNSRRRQ